MMNIDELIWPDRESIFISYSKETWSTIVVNLLNTFEKYLNIPIEITDNIDENVGEGFCVDFQSKKNMLNAINISYKGILGCALIGDPISLHISISLFLYSNKKKLITNKNESFIEFEYVRDSNGKGKWQYLNWKEDIYEEFDYYDRF